MIAIVPVIDNLVCLDGLRSDSPLKETQLLVSVEPIQPETKFQVISWTSRPEIAMTGLLFVALGYHGDYFHFHYRRYYNH